MVMSHDTALLAGPEAEPEEAGGRRRAWTLAVACAAVALVICMVSTVTTALPDLAAALGAGQTQQTWIVDAYTLVLAALVLPAGALGDRYGRRATLVAGLVVFALGCAVPLLIDSTGWMIASRAVSGLGAAFIMPSTLSLITASFTGRGRSGAIGVWAAVASLGGLLGVLLTGFVLQHYSWHGVFLLPAVLAAALAVAGCTLSASRESGARPLDVPGAACSSLTVGALVFGILESADYGWGSPVVIGALTAGVILGAVFVRTELRRGHPLLDVRLFGNWKLATGALSVTLQFTAAFGLMYGVIQYLQLVRGYSPLASAIALWPIAVVMLPLALVSARLSQRFGLRPVTFCGLAAVAVGAVLLGRLGPHTAYPPVGIAVSVLGAGIGLASPAATGAIMDSMQANRYGVGSALNDVTREVGSALGIALAGSILSSGYTRQVSAAAAHLPSAAHLPPAVHQAATSSIAAALPAAARLGPAGRALADAARAAFCHGMWLGSAALAAIVAAGAVAVLFLRTRASRS